MKFEDEIIELLSQARSIGARYYAMTGKPLGVTGEVAELAAAQKLGLKLAGARTPGYDAWRGSRKIQIKGRAVDRAKPYRGRVPAIKGVDFDSVVLVLLDRETLEPIEMWEASREAVRKRLDADGSKSRNVRRSMGVAQFRGCDGALRIWSEDAS